MQKKEIQLINNRIEIINNKLKKINTRIKTIDSHGIIYQYLNLKDQHTLYNTWNGATIKKKKH